MTDSEVHIKSVFTQCGLSLSIQCLYSRSRDYWHCSFSLAASEHMWNYDGNNKSVKKKKKNLSKLEGFLS